MAHGEPLEPGTLVTRKEIEGMLGRSRQRVHVLTSAEDFPRPIDDGDDHRHPIWSRQAVEEWIAARSGSF